MNLNYLQQTGIQAILMKENKRIAKRSKFLYRPPFDFMRMKSIYETAKDCFLNEYVWEETETETKRIDEIIEKLKSGNISDTNDIAYFIPVVACYRPLFKTDIKDLALSKEKDINKPEYSDLIKYSIKNPLEEEDLKKEIPVFSEITDAVSKKVKAQYEDNPYPRWVYKKSTVQAEATNEQLEILIAGCGSGSAAIYAALEQPNCIITAIDLSLSSLAYGKRIADELGIKNIQFMNGDILNVSELNKEFDYIHCTGVLHHLKDPSLGWEKLVAVLKNGGLMSIGLYSQKARVPVTMVKEYIAENNISYSPQSLRNVRHYVKNLHVDDPILRIALMGDFYSLSECRDMLFHEQEHQFTIPQIKDLLNKLDLEFLGFQKKDNRINKFLQKYPDPAQQLDLDLWDKFEQDHPETFIGMYMFNCKKA